MFRVLMSVLFSIETQSASGAAMLKIGSKRRRTRQEILDEKAIKQQRELEIDLKLAEYQSMKSNLASVNQTLN